MIARNEATRVPAICCVESGFSSRLENERSTTQGVDFAILKITTEYAQLFDPVEISILVAGIAEINIRPRSGNRWTSILQYRCCIRCRRERNSSESVFKKYRFLWREKLLFRFVSFRLNINARLETIVRVLEEMQDEPRLIVVEDRRQVVFESNARMDESKISQSEKLESIVGNVEAANASRHRVYREWSQWYTFPLSPRPRLHEALGRTPRDKTHLRSALVHGTQSSEAFYLSTNQFICRYSFFLLDRLFNVLSCRRVRWKDENVAKWQTTTRFS